MFINVSEKRARDKKEFILTPINLKNLVVIIVFDQAGKLHQFSIPETIQFIDLSMLNI